MKESMRNILFFFMVLFFYSCSSEKQGRNAVDYSMMNNLKVSVENAVDIDVKSAMCLSASEFMKNHLEALTYVQLDSTLPLGNVEKLTEQEARLFYYQEARFMDIILKRVNCFII